MIPLKNRRVLLIGGAGFIGHNLALRLKEAGADVSVLDGLQVNNLLAYASSGPESPSRALYWKLLNQRLELLSQAQIPLFVQDARDYHALSMHVGKIKPQVVIQLAAVAHASRSNKDPYHTFDHSFRTLENALDASRGGGVEHFIYFSSSMVYGNFSDGVVHEDTPCKPIGIYGALKLGGEHLVTAYNQVFGLPYTIIRPSALYGERCVSRRVGQIFIENALEGLDITMKGDGTDCLDFTYIGDLVSGVMNVIENENSRNQIFNLTYGRGRSLQEMVDVLVAHFPGVRIRKQERDSLMPERGTLSIEKAKRLIGYSPRFPIEKGFAQYIEWYKNVAEEANQQGRALNERKIPQVNE